MKKIALVIAVFIALAAPLPALAQCAMCKANAESNKGNDKVKPMLSGLNSGIIVLAALPYTAIMVVGFIYYANWKRKQNGA